MKRLIPLILAAMSLSSCLREDTWCPLMYVSFEMEDEFLEGDYDSRIQNDVLLYIFRDDKLAYTHLIPYELIAEGAEYPVEKTRELTGELKFVAWAVKRDVSDNFNGGGPLTIHDDEYHPEYALGSSFQDQAIAMLPVDPASTDGHYSPIHSERYFGVLDPTGKEGWNRNSHHDITMRPAPGRIVVNITDAGDVLGKTQGEAHVVVSGVMSKMNLDGEALGSPVSVRVGLGEVSATTRAAEGTTHTTDTFGVLPSQPGQRLSVDIMNGDEKVETLAVHTDDNLHQSIKSGELLEFDYVLNSSEFTLTVGSWTRKISIVDL